jgi:hypothetical protein
LRWFQRGLHDFSLPRPETAPLLPKNWVLGLTESTRMYNQREGFATPNCAMGVDVISRRKTQDFDLTIRIIS